MPPLEIIFRGEHFNFLTMRLLASIQRLCILGRYGAIVIVLLLLLLLLLLVCVET